MFGKKDKAEKPAKAEKAPGKTKKSKGGSSSGKSGPNFFAAHIEKLIMGVVVAAAGYLVYAGFSGAGYPTDRDPSSLSQSSSQVLQQISEDHWPAIAAEREVKHSFVPDVEKARRPTDADSYAIGSLREASSGPRELRGDPKVLPPEQLVLRCVSGAIAIEVPKETPDPFEAFEDADRITNSRRPQRRNNQPEEEDDEDKIKPPPRRLLSKYDLGAQIGAMLGMAGEGGMGMGGMGMGGMGMGGMGDMGGGMGMGGSGMGMGGMGEGGMAGGAGAGAGGGLGNNRDRGPKTKIASQGAIFVAATALVRHKEMFEEFERQLKNSGDYVFSRDTPVYLSFEVQRVDVTKDPARVVAEAEWKTVSDGAKQVAMRKNWAIRPPLGRPVPEVVDMNARHPGLTMPIPPMLIKDYRDFCKHPAINWVWDTKMLIAPPKKDDQKKKENEGEEDTLPGQAGGGAAAGMGGMGMGGMGMGGMGDMGGMGMGGMGMGGMGMEGGMGSEGGYGGYGGEMGSDGGYGGYGGDMGSGMDGMGMGGMGMGGMGMGGMGMGGSGMGGMGMMAGPQPEFKMLRFYDMLTDKDLGKTFRYRVRLIMRDPNYPERIRFPDGDRDLIPAPQPSSLQKAVFDRVSDQRKIDDEAFKANNKARRKLLETPWSEPSQPVRISARYEAFAGLGAETGSTIRPSAVAGDSEASVVATFTELSTGVTYAKSFGDAKRGSVLNAKKDVLDFVVPANRVIKKREYQLLTNSIVIDMRGGEELGASSKRDGDPLAASGEVMLMLGDGSIEFTSDIDDTFEYRMHTFADEHEAAKRMAANGGMGGMGGMGGEGGMMGGEGGMGMGSGMGEGGMGGMGGRGGRGGR